MRLPEAPEFIDLTDVRMFEFDGNFRFVDEHRDEIGIGGEVWQDAFDREKAFKSGRVEQLCPINFSHPPDADAFE